MIKSVDLTVLCLGIGDVYNSERKVIGLTDAGQSVVIHYVVTRGPDRGRDGRETLAKNKLVTINYNRSRWARLMPA